MTNHTKTFIDLSDIVGFRFECKNPKCGAALTLPMLADINRGQPLRTCPSCRSSWAQVGGAEGYGATNYEMYIEDLVECLKKLKGAPFGFVLTLELKNQPSASQTSVQAK
ncbi:MAG: hypothetical protein LAN63_16015 [Acidobacteriia bacterium]|nr:hypothetical protein [Terriglobia bacterium]